MSLYLEMLKNHLSFPIGVCLLLLPMHAIAQLSDCHLIHRVPHKECAYPRLSADSKSVLYQSNEAGNWHLYVMERTGKKHNAITNGSSNNNFPDWSPDNKKVAFVSDRDGNEEIYLINSDGSGIKRLTFDEGRDIHPYFSPDGKYILFNSTRGNGSLDIFRYDLTTAKVDRVTNTPDHETCARYSNDMRSIVFLRNNDESDDIYLMNVNAGVTRNLTNTPSRTDGWPMFSPDDRWVYFSSMDKGTYSMYRIKVDGSSRQQLSYAEEGEEHARVFIARQANALLYNRRKGLEIEIFICSLES